MKSPAAKALPLVLVLTLVWGTNWALFPLAVKEVSVWTFRAVSLVASGLLLLAYARARGISTSIPRRYWVAVTAASLIYLVVWNLASTYAAILIPSGQAAILGFTMPMWTVLVAWVLFGEKPNARLKLAIGLAALGTIADVARTALRRRKAALASSSDDTLRTLHAWTEAACPVCMIAGRLNVTDVVSS